MLDPETLDTAALVAAAAPLVGLHLTAEREAQVAEALKLVVRTALPALQVPVAPEEEPAPVYTP